MNGRRFEVLRVGFLFGVSGAFLLCAGCSSTSFGTDLSATPEPFEMREERSISMALPKAGPFSIHLSQSSRQAGLRGKASSDAQDSPDGTGEVSAKVENGGSASGTIQLGHSFRNDTTRQVDLTARVRYKYEYRLTSQPEARQVGASVGIRLIAKDDRGRLLRDLPLVTQTTEQGSGSRQAGEDLSFTVTLGPGQTALIYVAANASVDVIEDRSAEATLSIRELQMDIETQVSPAVTPLPAPAGTPDARSTPATQPARR